MACQKCKELQEEIDFLKSQLGERDDAGQIVKLNHTLKIGPQVVKIILRLYGARGRVVPKWVLEEAAGITDKAGNGLAVRVTHARNALACEGPSIVIASGEGYMMTREGCERVDFLLSAEAPPREVKPGGVRLFTEAEVRLIRWMDLPYDEIAAMYGVSQVAIHQIKTRKNYKWVTDDPAGPPPEPPGRYLPRAAKAGRRERR